MKTRLLCLASILAIVATAGAREYSAAERKAMFIESPAPDYTVLLQRRQLSGSGVYRLFIDEQGKVTKVTVLQSMDFPLLDAEAIKGLSRWRARPGPLREVDVPVTFSMPVNRLFITPNGARVVKINGNLKTPLTLSAASGDRSALGKLVYVPRRITAIGYSAVAFVAEGMSDADASRNFAAWLIHPHEPLAFWNVGTQRL
jgi:TonB family protein